MYKVHAEIRTITVELKKLSFRPNNEVNIFFIQREKTSLYRIYFNFQNDKNSKNLFFNEQIYFFSVHPMIDCFILTQKQSKLIYTHLVRKIIVITYSRTRYTVCISTYPIRNQHELLAHPGGKKWDWYLFTQRKIDCSLNSRSNKTAAIFFFYHSTRNYTDFSTHLLKQLTNNCIV